MAAFEGVSQMKIRPHERHSSIDFRSARLPKNQRVPSLGPDGSEDYNPLEHREPKQRIPIWMAYFNMIRTGLGAGLLGFPLAISQIGLQLGPALALFSGLLIIHMHLVLLKCLNEISRRLKIPIISYRYGFRIALLHGPQITHGLGRHGPCIIATFMLMSQVGICAVFIDFTADNLRDLLDMQSSRTCMMLLFLPYMLLEFSTATNVVGLVLVFYHIFLEPHGELIHAKIEALPLAFCFGTYLFNLSAVGVVLSIDKALVNTTLMFHSYYGVVSFGMGLPLTVATIFGMLGYWSFGTMEENVLRSLPYDDNTSMIAVGLYMFAVAMSYPIQCYPAIQIILEIVKNHDPYDEPSDKTLKLVEYIARPSFLTLTFICAYLMPVQAPFVAFVGNLCTTMLALVFPALMEICLMYPGPYGKYSLCLYKDLFIIALGVTSWIFGAVICGYFLFLRIHLAESPNNSNYLK